MVHAYNSRTREMRWREYHKFPGQSASSEDLHNNKQERKTQSLHCGLQIFVATHPAVIRVAEMELLRDSILGQILSSAEV